MIKTNFHTHCFLCGHAEGYPSDYIKKAVELGFKEIGISDHGPLLTKWIHRMNMNTFESVYLKDIEEAISKYKDKIKVYKGLEIEYLKGFDEHYENLLQKLDYLILGQHVVEINNEIVDMYDNIDQKIVEEYINEVIKGMDTGYFKILAHPDLFMYKFSGPWNEKIEKMCKKMIESSIKNNVFLELNVNGARRGIIKNNKGEDTWKYPYLDFWRLVSTYEDAKVIINADCHEIRFLYDETTEKVIELANKLKLKIYDTIGEK